MNSTTPDKPNRNALGRSEPVRRRRWLPWAGLAVLVVLITAGLWPRPVPIETAVVRSGRLEASVNEEGKTRIKQRYVIAAPITGQLRRIPLKAGSEVLAGGTVLAVIDPLAPAPLDARALAQAQARRDTAVANRDKAKTAHAFARSELQRFEKLFADQAVSIQELEPIQWREAAAARDLTAAESTLRQAEAELAEFSSASNGSGDACRTPAEVTAPTSGRVLRVFEESARVVTAGTPLLEVGDPSDLEVVVEVLSRDGAAIAPGARVELEQWGGGAPLAGKVRLVEPAAFTKVSALGVEEQRVRVIVDVLTPPDQRRTLGDQFRVEARIIVWEADRALKVPSGALFRRGSDWATFVVEGGRAHLRSLKAGRASARETQVLEGLSEGATVILYPGDRVRDRSRVKPIQIAAEH